MAQNESTLGDQSNSPKNKGNNVTEFNSQQSKGGTSSSTGSQSKSGTSSSTGSQSTTGTSSSNIGTQTGGGTSSSNVGSMGGTTSDSSLSRGTGTGSSVGSGSGSSGAATATARSLIDQAKETASQAYGAVTDKAATKLDEQKSTLSEGLSTVANSVRQVGENLGSSQTESGLAEAAAKYTNNAAQKLDDVAGYFETKNVREMARDLEGYARRNPAVFLGAAFGLGFLAARFLKSTSPRYDSISAGQDFSTSTQNRDSNLGNTPGF